jgi:hypothetical protein
MSLLPNWLCVALLLSVACGGISRADRQAAGSANDATSGGTNGVSSGSPATSGGTGGASPAFSASTDLSQIPSCPSGNIIGNVPEDPASVGTFQLTFVGDPLPGKYDGEVVVSQSNSEALVLDVEAPAGQAERGVEISWETPLPPLAMGLKLWLSLDSVASEQSAWSVRDRREGTLLFGQSSNESLDVFRVLGGSDLCAAPTYYCGVDGERVVPQTVQLQADAVTAVDSGSSPTLLAGGLEYQVYVGASRWILGSPTCGAARKDAGPSYRLSARLKDITSVVGAAPSP